MPARRSFLGLAAGFVSTSGCLVEDGCSGITLRTVTRDPVTLLRDAAEPARTDTEVEIVSRAPEPVTRESVIVTPGYYEYDGVLYRVDRSLAPRDDSPWLSVRATRVDHGDVPTDTSVADYRTLAGPDRRTVWPVLLALKDLADGESVQRAVLVSDGPGEETLTAGTDRWIGTDDGLYRLEVAEGRSVPADAHVYRARALGEYRPEQQAYVDRRYLVSLSNAPERVRELVRTGLQDGYDRCLDDWETRASLEEWLTTTTAIPGRGMWYVEFDGERHLLEYTTWRREF